uniref:Uncharacterized protein n=1 Tax=Sphaerodactylus townsendi TaxID=933632 RepID=A0ACB8EL57_9SAUR
MLQEVESTTLKKQDMAIIKQNLPNWVIDLLPEEVPAGRRPDNMLQEVESTTLKKQDSTDNLQANLIFHKQKV